MFLLMSVGEFVCCVCVFNCLFCKWVCVCVCVCACTHVCVYVCVCVCVLTFVCVVSLSIPLVTCTICRKCVPISPT